MQLMMSMRMHSAPYFARGGGQAACSKGKPNER